MEEIFKIDQDSKKVSIIVPSYNSANTIVQTVKSILSQTHRDFEILIIDDGSEDSSAQVLAELEAKNSEIKVLYHRENLGVSTARNTGVINSTGRFVAFCDSDDLWYPSKLTKQITHMLKMNCAISFTAYDIIDYKGVRLGTKFLTKCTPSYRDMLYMNYIGNSTVMIDRTHIESFSQPKMRHEDYATWLELLRMKHSAFGLNEVLGAYRVHEGSLSSNKLKSAYWHFLVLHKWEALGLLNSLRFTIIGRLKLLFEKIK